MATATSCISTLPLHDALPIWPRDVAREPRLRHTAEQRQLPRLGLVVRTGQKFREPPAPVAAHEESDQLRRQNRPNGRDRKSTRLNSSHITISYAVFCLKKKKR